MTIAIITEAGVRKVAPLVVVAEQAAALATQAAGIASAVASERYYASYAAGNAATSPGQYFAVLGSGVYDFYLQGNATPVARLPVIDVSTGRLDVTGTVIGGAASSAQGQTAFAVRYLNNDLLNTFGSLRSSSATAIGYAVKPSPSAGDGWVSAAGNASTPRGALLLDGVKFKIGFAASATVAIGTAVTLTDAFSVTPSAITPGGDNAQSGGSGALRFTQLFAVTNVIGTSDAREKTWRGAMSPTEMAAAKRIVAELGFFQWNDAVAEKGEDARLHFGARAQDVWAIMADEGLIEPVTEEVRPDSRYAFLCYDEWDADESAGIVAGNRFGIRPDQLSLFLIAAQEARLSALEALISEGE